MIYLSTERLYDISVSAATTTKQQPAAKDQYIVNPNVHLNSKLVSISSHRPSKIIFTLSFV